MCGEHWWMERSRKDRSEGTKAGIHIAHPLPPWLHHPNFFLYHSMGCFFPCVFRELCKWWRDPFFFSCGQTKKRLKWEKCLLFFFRPLLTLPVNLSCRQCGPGVSALRPCERMMVAARAGGGGGSAHNDIHEELRRQPGKECWPCCWTAWHWLMRERKTERK